jgi:two-component system chemotaxis response regulator CheB
MKEEVLPFFIEDLQESLNISILKTPSILPSKPSVVVCSHTSTLHKEKNLFSLLTNTSEQNYTPDINKLFNSFVPYVNEFDIHILIMTGIGRDGIEATKRLKERGAFVIAQDEDTSPVFGMPKAAIEEGVVDQVKSLSQIKQYMRELNGSV